MTATIGERCHSARLLRMDVLDGIQAWHKAWCAAGRELALGVRIETLHDQPGWSVKIDLAGTPLAGLTLAPYQEGNGTARDWLAYRVHEDRFEGLGDPTKLQALLFAFLELAERTTRETRGNARR